MKRILIVILFILPIFIFGQNKLIMSGADNWYPIQMYDEKTHKVTGIGYDIFMEICSRLGIEGEAQGGFPWKRLFYFLETGEVNVINGAYSTEERNEKYLLTVPYLKNQTKVFVLRGNEFPFNDLSDLKGCLGGKPRGASYGDEFDSYAKENLDLYESETKENLIQMLLSNRIDYFISDFVDVTYALRNRGLEDRIIPLPKSINFINVHMIFSRTSEGYHFFEKFNLELKKMIDEGTIDKMLEKYK